MKKIVIETCMTCPNRDHKGAFGLISYVPTCRAVNKELPYTLATITNRYNKIVQASPTGVIPEWCHLEDN